MTAMTKFSSAPTVVHNLALAGFIGGKVTIVASLERLSAVLFLYPKTRPFGVVLLSAFLGGATSTHVRTGEFLRVVPAGMLLTLAWLGTCLRHPEVLWSFRQDGIKIRFH
jgi:hypothetical protein